MNQNSAAATAEPLCCHVPLPQDPPKGSQGGVSDLLESGRDGDAAAGLQPDAVGVP